jgi:putative lipoprotein
MKMTAGLIAVVAIAVLTGSAALVRADERDPWFGRDKAYHFSASALIAAGGYGVTRSFTDDRPTCLAVGGALALTAGVGKELYDLSGRGDPSLRDLTWDVLGTATGLLLIWAVDRFWISAPRARPASP